MSHEKHFPESHILNKSFIDQTCSVKMDIGLVHCFRDPSTHIGHYRNVRGLGKSMVVFSLFEKLRYSNERSTIF